MKKPQLLKKEGSLSPNSSFRMYSDSLNMSAKLKTVKMKMKKKVGTLRDLTGLIILANKFTKSSLPKEEENKSRMEWKDEDNTVADLIKMDDLSVESILENLKKRYSIDRFYVRNNKYIKTFFATYTICSS